MSIASKKLRLSKVTIKSLKTGIRAGITASCNTQCGNHGSGNASNAQTGCSEPPPVSTIWGGITAGCVFGGG